MLTTRLRSPAATRAAGEALGRLLRAGDVVALVGPLGAGKTCFSQGVAAGLGVPPDVYVNSPTFVIVNTHEGGRVPLYHIDLYRLSDADELVTVGYRDHLGGDGVALVEWWDRFADAQPAEHLEVRLTPTGVRTRRLDIVAHGARARALADALRDAGLVR